MVFAIVKGSKQRKAWLLALERLAQRYKLKFHKRDSAEDSEVDGQSERQHAIAVCWTSRSHLGAESSTPIVEIKVDPRDYGDARICEAGSWEPQTVDYSGDGDQKQETGDAAFDAKYDVWNARKQDLRRLRDPSTCAATRSLVRRSSSSAGRTRARAQGTAMGLRLASRERLSSPRFFQYCGTCSGP